MKHVLPSVFPKLLTLAHRSAAQRDGLPRLPKPGKQNARLQAEVAALAARVNQAAAPAVGK